MSPAAGLPRASVSPPVKGVVTLLTCLPGGWGAAAEVGWGGDPKLRSPLPNPHSSPAPLQEIRKDQGGLLPISSSPAPSPQLGVSQFIPRGNGPQGASLLRLPPPSQGTRSSAGPLEAINKAGRSRRGTGAAGGGGAESGTVPRTPWGLSQAVPLGSRPGLWSLWMGKGDMGGSSSPGD